MSRRVLLPIVAGLCLTLSARGQTGGEAAAQTPVTGAAPSGAAAASTADLLHAAAEDYRKGKLDAAEEAYQRVLKEEPKSAGAYAGLVRVYLQEDKVREAEEAVSKAAELNPDNSLVWAARGEVYFREGKMPEAEKEFVRAVKRNPTSARPRLGLARLYRSESLYHRAKTMMDMAYQLDPEDPDIFEFWLETVGRAEKIKAIEARLAGGAIENDQARKDWQTYLEELKAEEARPRHGCRLANKLTSTEIPMEPLLMDPNHMRGIGLALTVNGEKVRLMLDTGASGILINRRIAERAGITKAFASKVSGIGDKGERDSYFGYANSIKIGNLEFQGCHVEVLEKRSVLGDDGLIGADFFEDFLVDLSFPERKLKLTELPKRPNETRNGTEDEPQDRYVAPEMQSYARIFRFDHDLLVPTSVNDTTWRLFLLDTGSLANQISPEAAREITKVHDDPDMTVQGLSGYVKKVYSADKVMLQFGHLRQQNEDIVSIDLSSVSRSTGTEVSGILGFVMLHFLDIKIDYRDGLVDFEYDKDKRN